MDRAEATGFGVAAAGHIALLAALSLGFASTVTPPAFNPPMEISFVDDVAIESAAPSSEPAAATIAPELGPPEEAAPISEPEPVPPAPAPEPVPVPRPEPPKPVPKPVPKAKPTPPKPAPPKAAPKAAPAKTPQPKQAAPKAAPKQQAQPKAAGKGTGTKSGGSRLGADFLKGIGSDPAAKSNAPSGAVLSAQSLASIQAAIQRQIQPCANRQVNPGPGANEIRVKINIRLNRNGTLARRPTVVGEPTGVTDENQRYEQRVKDLAIAAYSQCSPLKGLPDELYQTAKGGWSNINMNYKLPD